MQADYKPIYKYKLILDWIEIALMINYIFIKVIIENWTDTVIWLGSVKFINHEYP